MERLMSGWETTTSVSKKRVPVDCEDRHSNAAGNCLFIIAERGRMSRKEENIEHEERRTLRA